MSAHDPNAERSGRFWPPSHRLGKKLTGRACPRTFGLIMLRKTSQLLLLPVLFALLAAGGRTTLCEVLSAVGMESHHHSHEGAPDGAGSLCLATHDHDHAPDHAPEPAHEDVPCPESCEIPLAEAPAPVLLKVPTLAETCVLPSLLRAMLAAPTPHELFDDVAKREPPDRADSLVDPIFTGRFLV